jgi:hypothetical protein
MSTKNIDPKQRALRDERNKEEGRLKELTLKQLDLYAETRGWDLTGEEVLYKLFAEKYHWTPAQVRSLTRHEVDALLKGEKDF